jgi:hypothetical protein
MFASGNSGVIAASGTATEGECAVLRAGEALIDELGQLRRPLLAKRAEDALDYVRSVRAGVARGHLSARKRCPDHAQ